MGFETIIFWLIALLTVGPGIFMIFSKNIVHMAFWLLGILMGVAGLYLYMGADFLGMTQVFVYIGGINVLLLFGIMLTNKDPIFVRKTVRMPRKAPALLLGMLLLGVLIQAVGGTEWRSAPGAVEPTSKKLGMYLLSDYVLAFEIVSILLLVVLVGAAFIARRTDPDGAA